MEPRRGPAPRTRWARSRQAGRDAGLKVVFKEVVLSCFNEHTGLLTNGQRSNQSAARGFAFVRSVEARRSTRALTGARRGTPGATADTPHTSHNGFPCVRSLRKGLRRLNALPVIMLLLGFATPSAAGPSRPETSPAMVTNPTQVFTVPQVSKPGYLSPITDPTFGTTVTSICGSTGTAIPTIGGTWQSLARHTYSVHQAWNSTGTRLWIQQTGVNNLVLDGNTYAPLYLGGAGDDSRWHPSVNHPGIRIGVNYSSNPALDAKTLYWDSVSASGRTRVKSITLPFSTNIPVHGSNGGLGGAKGNPCTSGRYVALCNNDSLFVVDMDATPMKIGPRYHIPPPSFRIQYGACGTDYPEDVAWCSISPSAQYVVVGYIGCASDTTQGLARVFDVDTATCTIRGPHTMGSYASGAARCGGKRDSTAGWIWSWNHRDMGMNASGDVIAGGFANDDATHAYGGHAGMVQLATGVSSFLLTNHTNEAYVLHASCRNFKREGWAYFSYYSHINEGTEGRRFNDEVVAIKLDGSGAVERICHQHSNVSGCYACQPQATPSPDGLRVAFASNWASDCGTGCGSASESKGYIVGSSPPADITPPARIQDLNVVK